MTEPDEALRWAREQLATFWEKAPGVRAADRAAHINNARSGASDGDLEDAVTGRLHWLDGNRAGAAASAERIKALEARVAELEVALAKANEPHWFYSADNAAPEHSLEDAIEGAIYDITTFGDHLLEIETARPCSTIWGVVRLLTEDEAEARLTEEPWVFTRCATEAEARALLKEPRDD